MSLLKYNFRCFHKSYLFELTDSVSAIHGLKIHLGVPIRVVENNDVGCVQVDAETSGASGQHEDKLLAVFDVVFLLANNQT